MKGQSLWSYAPYRPFLYPSGDIYICRVAPTMDAITLDWLDIGDKQYAVYCRVRGEGKFSLVGETNRCTFTVTGGVPDTDYEFYVASGDKCSRVRLARCGAVEGTVVNYLHPDDEVYSFSGRYLCSPSLVRHPDGYLLASMDLYAPSAPQNLSLIFRSDDNGESWYYLSELMPCFWGKLFVHRGVLYMLSCSTEYGDLLIGKSEDGGRTFSAPVTLLRGLGGKLKSVGVHKNPQNMLSYNGRLYETLEWGSWGNTEYYHAAMVMSCDESDDLMNPESWHFTPPVKYDPNWEGVAEDGFKGNIEGTLCIAPDGGLYNYMRYQTEEKKILVYRVNTDDPDAPLIYSHAVDFPGNLSKFMIKYDEESCRYYSIVCRRIDAPKTNRNLLSLVSSDDLTYWTVERDLLDHRDADPKKVGFQYVDFLFDGADIIYLCRTAMNDANNFHNSNYSTFHRIRDFRHK